METPTAPPTLYLRADGTLLLVQADRTIEMALNAGQLLQLGMDALTLAVQLDRTTLAAAAAALDSTVIPPELQPAAAAALTNSQIVPVGHAH